MGSDNSSPVGHAKTVETEAVTANTSNNANANANANMNTPQGNVMPPWYQSPWYLPPFVMLPPSNQWMQMEVLRQSVQQAEIENATQFNARQEARFVELPTSTGRTPGRLAAQCPTRPPLPSTGRGKRGNDQEQV